MSTTAVLPVETNSLFRRLAWSVLFVLLLPSVWAYNVAKNEGQPITWNAGTVTMQVKLGASSILSDGATYNSSVQTALQFWNTQLGTLQFANQIVSPAAPADDTVNEIGFDSTVYGTAFDANVLAVTSYYYSATPRSDGTYRRTRADIVFSTAYTWDSYRGSLRTAQDIQRVALHELGHVLGIDHPDQAVPPQNVTALMNSHVSNLDTLAADDIAGAQSLYGAITAAPTFSNQPTSQAAVRGQSVQFSITVVGSPVPSIRWQRLPVGGAWSDLNEGSGYSGTGTATLAIAVAQLTMNGDQFRCVATNIVGSITSDAAILTVGEPAPPAFLVQPANITVASGQSAVFSATASGGPSLTYKWQRQMAGSVIWSDLLYVYPGDHSNTLTVTATGAGMSGDHFRCVATNSEGSATSNDALLSVNLNINPISYVAAGNRHTLIVKTDGSLWSTGWNAYGQLGDGSTTDTSNPVRIASGVTKIAAGGGTSFFIKTNGTLWAMGWNYTGQLGDGTTTDRHTPVQIATAVASVSAGDSHVVFVKTDGTLWSFGLNSFGQLGDGTTIDRHAPVQIAVGVSCAAAGVQQTLFVKTDGTMWASGWNGYGQLGDGTITDHPTPIQIASGVASVACGYEYSMFIKTDGTLWGMGYNNWGQLGDGTVTARRSPVQVASGVVQVSAGFDHTMFLKADGTLWAMGDGNSGDLCTGTTQAVVYPAQVAVGVATFSAGMIYTVYVKDDGAMWAAGYNIYGALGDGSPVPYGTTHVIPIQVAGPIPLPVLPTITTQPVSQSTTAGGSVTFTVAATGTPMPTFQWKKNSISIPGATSNALSIYNINSADAGTYTVAVTNSVGSVLSGSAVLTVTPAPGAPVVTTQPLSHASFVGGAVSMICVVSGTPAPNYQWQKGGINIPGATNSTLTLNNIQLSDAGSYGLVATNANGSSTSRFSRLVVLVPQQNAITYATTRSSTGVTAGGIVNFDYFVTNVGTKTWGAHHYLSIRDVNNTFVAFSSLIGILPGETTTANLSFPAPTTPGTYTYYVQGLEDGVEFFSTQTTVVLTVLAPVTNAITYNTTSFPVSAAPGSNVIFTYNVTNTGTATWGANHLLSLKDSNGTTLSTTPLTVLAPGASKTVNLSLTVPSAPGSYNYTVQASQTGVGNFGTQANLTLVALAPQPNAIVYNRVRYPDSVVPGAVLNLKYTLSNAGTQAWGAGHYVSLRDSAEAYLSFIPLAGTAAGGTKTVEFTLTAPTTPGTYTYYVQALEDGIEFFSTQDVIIVKVVALPLGNAVSYNTSTIPVTAAPGATVNFTANVTNRGTTTWGTTHYLSFRDVDNTFLAFPTLSGVAPGASRTANLSFTAPTTPGIYTYTLQAFEDGVSFFEMADTVVLLVQ